MELTQTTVFAADYQAFLKKGQPSMRALRKVQGVQRDAAKAGSGGAGRFRPSLIGQQCDRVQVLSHEGQPSSGVGSWYTWSGTWLHLAFQTFMISKYASKVEIEHAVSGRGRWFGVRGRADWFWHGGSLPSEKNRSAVVGPHVGDYKTVGSLTKVRDAPDPRHVDQLLLEMCVLNVRNAYVVYQDRAHGAMAVWHLEADGDDVERMAQRVGSLRQHTNDATLPPVLDVCRSMKGRMYEYCGHNEACFAELAKGR